MGGFDISTMKVVIFTFASLLATMLACTSGSTECSGGAIGGAERCLDSVTPQWCSVSGGASPGALFNSGTNTATWVDMQKCQAPSMCVVIPNIGGLPQAVCSPSNSPVDACAGQQKGACLDGVPGGCVAGFPVLSSIGPCPHACEQGFCVLSSTPDPRCPTDASQSSYCSGGILVNCEFGFDLDPAIYPPAMPGGDACRDFDGSSSDGSSSDGNSSDGATPAP